MPNNSDPQNMLENKSLVAVGEPTAASVSKNPLNFPVKIREILFLKILLGFLLLL